MVPLLVRIPVLVMIPSKLLVSSLELMRIPSISISPELLTGLDIVTVCPVLIVFSSAVSGTPGFPSESCQVLEDDQGPLFTEVKVSDSVSVVGIG